MPSPVAWGTEDRLAELLGGDARLEVTRRRFTFRFRTAGEYVDTFTAYYGPLVRAWEALDADGRSSLRSQLVALAEGANRGTGATLLVPSEYLEVVATRHAER